MEIGTLMHPELGVQGSPWGGGRLSSVGGGGHPSLNLCCI